MFENTNTLAIILSFIIVLLLLIITYQYQSKQFWKREAIYHKDHKKLIVNELKLQIDILEIELKNQNKPNIQHIKTIKINVQEDKRDPNLPIK